MNEIHASQITTYQTCPRMYRYRYIEKLVPKVTSPKLFLGRAGHTGLAAYYQTGKKEAALEAYRADIQAQLNQIASEVDLTKWEEFQQQAALGEKLVDYYVDWAQKNDFFRAIAVEQPFEVPIFTPDDKELPDVKYVGTFDGIAEDVYGTLWLLEHKFYSQVPAYNVLRLDLQAGLYLMAASMLFPDRRFGGIIYNIIRKTAPEKAKNDVVVRRTVVRTYKEIELLKKRLYTIFEVMSNDVIHLPHPGLHCGWKCPYTDLCIAEEEGADEYTISSLKEMLYKEEEPPTVLVGGNGDEEL